MSKDTSVPAKTSLNKVYSAEAGLLSLAPVQMYTSIVMSVIDPARAE
jgi:hypothetical protein